MPTPTIEQLNATKPRELDAMGAERIMGWTLETQRGNIRGARTKDGKFWIIDGEQMQGFANIWNPSTDPAADYSILQFVREKWDSNQWCFFQRSLRQIQEVRNHRFGRDDDAACMYEVGDYLKSALLSQENS